MPKDAPLETGLPGGRSDGHKARQVILPARRVCAPLNSSRFIQARSCRLRPLHLYYGTSPKRVKKTQGGTVMTTERLAVDVKEAAKMLGIGLRTAWKAVQDGRIPTVRYGKRVVVPLSALREMVHKQAMAPKPAAAAQKTAAPGSDPAAAPSGH